MKDIFPHCLLTPGKNTFQTTRIERTGFVFRCYSILQRLPTTIALVPQQQLNCESQKLKVAGVSTKKLQLILNQSTDYLTDGGRDLCAFLLLTVVFGCLVEIGALRP